MAHDETSHYVHGTLYKWSEPARNAVLARLADAVQDTPTKCWYDVQTDCFHLQCPSIHGPNADRQIAQIIKDYIDQELDAATTEHRPPTITRYVESALDALDNFEDATNETAMEGSSKIAEARSYKSTHIIITFADREPRVKLFPLYKLPPILERTLASNTKRSYKLLDKGLVCRAAKWDSCKGWLCDDRPHQRQPPAQSPTFPVPQAPSLDKSARSSIAGRDIPGLPTFSILQDDRPEVEREITDSSAIPQDVVEEQERTTVGQWLAKTGQTEHMDDPTSRPDMPKDARRLLAATQTHVVGRARVPKGAVVLPSDEDESDQDCSDEMDRSELQERLQPRISPLKHVRRTSSSRSDADDSSADDEQTSFQDLLPDGEHTAQTRSIQAGLVQTPAKTQAIGGTHAFKDSVHEALRNRSDPLTSLGSGHASYNVGAKTESDWTTGTRTHAKVDRIGLTANAHHTAQWHVGNQLRLPYEKTFSRTKRVVPRDSSTASVSTSLSCATNGHSNFEPPNVVSRISDSDPAVASIGAGAGSYTRSAPLIDTESVNDEEPPTAMLQAPLHNHAPKQDTMRQKPATKVKGKSKSQSKTKGQHFGAQLQLPGPLPAPRSSKKKENILPGPIIPTTRNEVRHSKTASRVSSDAGLFDGVSAAHLPHLKLSTRITRNAHAFGARLAKERLKQEVGDEDEDEIAHCDSHVKLTAQVGTILLRLHDEDRKILTRSGSTPSEVQHNLRERPNDVKTDFLSRLTTSSQDAQWLIKLGAGNMDASRVDACYEVQIRDAARMVLKVIVSAAEKSEYAITTYDRTLAEACVHFPMHAWDARFSITQAGQGGASSSADAIIAFISSMTTDQHAPSFRAQVASNLFTVERVLAKRTLSYAVPDSRTTFHVVQTHDLVLERPDLTRRDTRYNFRAMSLSREEMVAGNRLWWEVKWEADLSEANELQARVNEVVRSMDDVGLENKGPLIVPEGYQSDDDKVEEVADRPFW